MHHNAFNAAMAPNPIENLVHNDDAVEADEADEADKWESVMGL